MAKYPCLLCGSEVHEELRTVHEDATYLTLYAGYPRSGCGPRGQRLAMLVSWSGRVPTNYLYCTKDW